MTQSAFDIANTQQRDASNPEVSTFVAASAGTGKTKLLTDRILRLLLTGTPAHKILCLTYTKAAAAEMTIRLNLRLGAWVIMSADELSNELRQLDVIVTEATLAIARRLFAEILDLPGNMKISTIHSFCQSLLKRFPLEAQLSPYFEVEDETEVMTRLRQARELTLSDSKNAEAIFSVARETNETEFAKMVPRFSQSNEIQALVNQFSFEALTAMQAAALNAIPLSDERFKDLMLEIPNRIELTTSFTKIFAQGTPSGKAWAENCLVWLSKQRDEQYEQWEFWWNQNFINSGKRRALSGYFGKALNSERDELLISIEAERDRLERIAELKKSNNLADLNFSLIRLMSPIMQSYRHEKTEQSLLSYSDLIAATLDLLSKPEQVAWILYKLDEGIDHLLLDEVQDTAPAQWQITDALADEFFNGAGARDASRSIFAVGDHKQSIFSFQGADLDSFDAARRRFRALVGNSGQKWLDGDLSVSFRSTEPVLSLVDCVFSEGQACQGVCEPASLKHFVSRQGQAGAVTLWPLTKPSDMSPPPDWDTPDSYTSKRSEKAILAAQIAGHIKARLENGDVLPSRDRAITAGDFLILVRHRDELVFEITRACKSIDIPIAGLDRLVLTDQQAVSDLLALCDSLLLPLDDLAFAQFLVSPLGNLSDESLMELALGRRGSLSAALFARRLEREDWREANEFFQTLRRQVDFISPFSLLALALGALGGRARLLQRLGAEAAEPINELLAEAQSYAQSHPASLQQFVFDFRQSGATVKREPEGIGDVVRIMTVHGAKGLQAPVVIMPDTTTIPKTSENLFWLKVPQQNEHVPIFCPHKDLRSNAITEAIATAKKAKLAEYNRLLYVALTRAEDELIICGAEGKNQAPEDCWYHSVRLGFVRLGVQARADGTQEHRCPQTADPDRVSRRQEMFESALPKWAGVAPAWQSVAPTLTETRRPEPLAPSRSADEKEAHAVAASPLRPKTAPETNALAKGKIVHTLLQHLPLLPEAERTKAARHYLGQAGLGLSRKLQSDIERAVTRLFENKAAQAVFGPGSRAEVPLAGIVGEVEVGGLVDRMVVQDTTVLLVDFKTDRNPPLDVANIPPAYLRQLAAYTAILEQIFPEKSVQCQLIWTETASFMQIAKELLAGHAPTPAQPFPGFVNA